MKGGTKMINYCGKTDCPRVKWMMKGNDFNQEMILNECRYCDERGG